MSLIKSTTSVVKKDLISLMGLVILSVIVFSIEPVVANLDLQSNNEIWTTIVANFYWVSYALAILLMISVLQLDPASSLEHDWLTRPIPRSNWLLAKLLFLFVTICLPIVLARLFVNLGSGYDLGNAVGYAFAIEKPPALLPVPLFFAAALLTPTLRKTIFVTFVVFVIFISPGWSGAQPLLRFLGIDLTSYYGAMAWLQALPMTLAGIAAVLLVYWFSYCQRQHTRAYFAGGVCLSFYFLAMYPPQSLYNWEVAIDIHKSFINDENESLEASVILEHTQACFTATAINNDSVSESNDFLLEQAGWYRYEQPHLIPSSDSLTFATRVKTREILIDWFLASHTTKAIAVDWRVDRIRVQGRLTADSLSNDIKLRRSDMALNRDAPISSVATDYWLIDVDTARTLAKDPTTQLVLDYDLALLKPTAYELPTDGEPRTFPKLGSCRAEVDGGANAIAVDCIKYGNQPALVSAELVGVDAGRVDSDIHATLKPNWLEAISRKHYELSIKYPNLVDSSAIMLTAYEVESIVSKQLISTGIFGNTPSVCPLPSRNEFTAIEKSSWSDKSPHEISSVAVERGVRVEVLDWRKQKHYDTPTLVLLHGLSATAHAYDQLAPKLAERYPVIGITRRGVGDSSKPDHGYDTARLSQDVLQVLDTLDIESPILVGHSIGGEELNYLGAHHPEQFTGLIYLDAAYDRTVAASDKFHTLNARLPDRPPPRPSELVSYEATNQYVQRIGEKANLPEGELLATYDLANGTMKHNRLYFDAIMMGLQAPDYENIPLPTLGIFAVPSSPQSLMEAWYDQNDPSVQESVVELFKIERFTKTQAIARFDNAVANSEVLVLEDADHWVFLTHEQEVIEAIDQFVTGLEK